MLPAPPSPTRHGDTSLDWGTVGTALWYYVQARRHLGAGPPPQCGLRWTRVEAMLEHLGAEVYEGSGSTVTFVLSGRKFTADRPHPRRECGIGLVKRVRSFLQTTGDL